ncbi:S1C family serine protease [Halonatronum saccharophilum]|uniref:S1C family serine protease n=1 Tax=Halonatronum saccharophilum TaxID=150060 RepID=UPI000489030A|nr:trypsin-like peptidase domain-containing protein [Halonatronum saccharophilum]
MLILKKKLAYLSCFVLLVLGGIFFINLSEVDAFWGSKGFESDREEVINKIVISQEEAVKKAVKDVGPAVVSIVTVDTEIVRDFFFNPIPREREGLGSGVIIDKEGYILTNNHVISNADEIRVFLSDGRDYDAEFIGSDPRNDLAVIKVNGSDLPIAPLGDSDDLVAGQLAIAIGSPYDLQFQNTVTTGVVSALDREIRPQSRNSRQVGVLDGLIQTDASINPGNSGGPLLDSQGRVIGINTAIIGDAQGIGFSIPINRAKEVIDDLINYGRVKRPWLGIYGSPINQDVINYYNLPVDKGVIIARVVGDSPAAEGGLKRNDIILEANREEVGDMNKLRKIINEVGIGGELKLLLMDTAGDLKTARVELKELEVEE